MGSYKGTGAAGFVLPLRVSYYAHTYSVFKVRKPEAFKIPPLANSHTMPAIAYTSGMFSLPSAAARGGRWAVAGSLRFSRFSLARGEPVSPVSTASLESGAPVNPSQPVSGLAHNARVRT
jgi:hypothetical protein